MKNHIICNIFCLVLISFLACRQTYEIHLQETFFSAHVARGNRQHSLAEGVAIDSVFSIKGVYEAVQIGNHFVPTIMRFDPINGVGYVVLAESLSVKKGTWAFAKGKILEKAFSIGSGRIGSQMPALAVEELRIIQDMSSYACKAQMEYAKHRDGLQNSIAIEGSKLTLPEQPDWLLLIDENQNRVIVSMHTNDLMYEAEVDFILDLQNKKIISLYADEWFKGE